MSDVDRQLMAISSVDGRYADRVAELEPMVSEYGLIKYRAEVEIAWLRMIGVIDLPGTDPLSDRQIGALDSLEADFSMDDARRVKELEKEKNHDVKAVEEWLRERLVGSDIPFDNYPTLVHIGCTSEDITNLAYAHMLSQVRAEVLTPNLGKIAGSLEHRAHEYADIPMLARTHGQPAVTTTVGKEMAVFADRLIRGVDRLGAVSIRGKFGGATGNHNALTYAYPEIDWIEVAQRFVEGLGYEYADLTTQIEPHDWNAEYANAVTQANSVLQDLSVDMWLYISNGIFKQQAVAGEVGSSTMPHKVNPIDFENAEANLGVANALFQYLALKLPVSRLQRDLSDSSAQRVWGTALGHSLVGYKSLVKGLGKSHPDRAAIADELDNEWAILTEPVQIVMRRYGVEGAYDKIKEVSRGRSIGHEEYLEIVETSGLPEDEKQRLRELTPATYIGRAVDLVVGNPRTL